MNKAKKIIKEQGLQQPDKKEVKKKAKSRKNLILIVIGALAILGGVFVVCYTQLRPRPVLIVEGPGADGDNSKDTVNYTDSIYHIYKMESMYNAYGMDWDQDSGGGSLSQSVKNQIMEELEKREVLYMQAQKEGLTLDDKEKEEVDTTVEEAMKDVAQNGNGVRGLSKSYVKDSIEKQKLADKMQQKIIDGFDIDDEAIKAEVNKDDFRQYTLQYYTISKKEEGDDGEKDKSADTLTKNKADMEALCEKAKSAEDFTKLLTDSDEDGKDDATGISYDTRDLIETDEDFGDEEFRNTIKKMSNDQISDVLETDDAYYVIKMVNNNDPAAYDKEVKNKIESEETTKFNSYYDDTLVKQYKFQVTSYWKQRVQIGSITSPE